MHFRNWPFAAINLSLPGGFNIFVSKFRLRISWIPIIEASAPVSDVACKAPMGARFRRELNFIDICGAALVSASLTEFCDTFLTWPVAFLRLPCGLLGLLLLEKHTAAKCPFLLHDEQIFSRARQVPCSLGGHIMLPHLVQAGLRGFDLERPRLYLFRLMNFLLSIRASSNRADSSDRQMAVVVSKSGSGEIAKSLVRVCLSQIPDIILVTSRRSIHALQRSASLASVLIAIKN